MSGSFEQSGFRYDDVAHKYYVDGREIPGVSYILSQSGITDDRFYKNNPTAGSDFGKAVHAACHFLDENDLAWDTVAPLVLPRVRAYEAFKKGTEFVPTFWERQLFHPLYRYGGTFDRLGTRRGELWLVDLKTGGLNRAVELQTAAYEHIVREWPNLFGFDTLEGKHIRRVAVFLLEDGTYKLHWCNEPRDFQVFVSALTVTNWKGGIK